ncbi:MAG: SDR family NAD(P)-dependent oxidoreductase [Ilumatobacteraceae bacterium]|jgi:3-hydroxybutyrate dehydrogenase|nr:SDR family NAD(P)-dependent oxidoreductase [Ilumatobacteraceae bacterium]HRA84121.1 SDR family NAD(P)-dependent oxidoreductase [Ilumatobacteraceae bacterium]HRC46892.1 SDR family NAD(P)-dependent oxidoreductase [Ilumatobacteraceae bacterium]
MLAGHRVLITGGGSGVGADMALAFAAAGAEVVVAGRRREALDAVVAGEPRMRAIEADVSVESDVVQLFAAAGPVDIVIANAGAAESAPITRTSIDVWQRMMAVNLTGVFLTLREGVRQLEGRGWGRLITVASTAGLRGYAYVSAYTAAKHGAVGLTRAVAQEVAGSGITANALCPGYVDTELTERTIANIMATTGRSHDEALRALTRANPQGRLVQPAEVTAAALWLCGPGSAAVNGQAIAIDGGEL